MMRSLSAAGLLFLATAAAAATGDKPPPEAYLDPTDQQIARTGVGLPGRPAPCVREERQNGTVTRVGLPTARCVRMQAPMRWRGLWRNDFEGSQFCASPATRCPPQGASGKVWLSGLDAVRPFGRVYHVEFLGRKTIYKGAYGHLGVFDQEIIVDKLVAMTPISP